MEIKKVLLVDDDPNIRKLAKMTLERVGKWEVDVAESGPEALEMLEQSLPDVVLLDVMMPDLDGVATLQRIRSNESFRHMPVILMTAKVQCQQIEEYVTMGAAGVIIKPFDPLELPEEIGKLLR